MKKKKQREEEGQINGQEGGVGVKYHFTPKICVYETREISHLSKSSTFIHPNTCKYPNTSDSF